MLLPLHRIGVRYQRFLLMIVMLLVGASGAWAQVASTYCFNVSSGPPASMAGAISLPCTNNDDGVTAVTNIGFNFVFNGTTYTQFSANSNGLMKLGSTVISGSRFNESMPGSEPTANDSPFLAPLWDDLYLRGNLIRYSVNGTAPNRQLVVEWNCEHYSGNNSEDLTMQVRLYEGSNKIEFWYGQLTILGTPDAWSATIAMGSSRTDYIGVDPVLGSRYSSGNVIVAPPPANTIYTFGTYYVAIGGDVVQGGTPAMNNGDILLGSVLLDPGTTQDFTPFTVVSIACGPANFTYTLGGTYPGDYQITPTTSIVESGTSATPRITFRPSGTGLRDATLTVSDGKSLVRTYNLRARAGSITYIGDVPQGGTTGMKSGDSLMSAIRIDRLSSGTYRPFSVNNVNTNPLGPGVTVNYSIVGTSRGQYSVTPGQVVLNPGQTHTPVITFTPTGFGVVIDTLIVTTSEGTMRRFPLKAISIAAAASFTINGVPLDSATNLLANQFGCTGSEVVSVPIRVRNVGIGALTIKGLDMFLTDTTIRQGVPEYPFLRNASGRPVAASDYFLTLQPGVTPYEANVQVAYPLRIEEGDEVTIYLNFLATTPGKRFGRVYLRTDAINLSNTDTAGIQREGLLRFGAFGRGYGARLSDNIEGGLPKAITFPDTKMGESSTATLHLVNPGHCSLRVSLKQLMITAGDVDEFAIDRLPNKRIDGTDLLLAPGEMDELVVRFTPKQRGSRRAGMRLATNDSTIHIPGITERGTYYIDLFGSGLADLYADGINFGQALIGGTGNDQLRGVARMRNTTNTPLTISGIEITGMDKGEFTEDPLNPWPSTPFVLQPGKETELGVIFAPVAGGTEGSRMAELELSTTVMTISAPLVGEAGTRTITVNPGVINFPVTTMGKYQRRMVAITNTGTMPVTLTGIDIFPNGENFQIGKLDRLELVPGQVEYLEVTYVPSTAGKVEATLEVGGNMTNVAQVQLGGTSFKPNKQDDPIDMVAGRPGVIEDGVSMADGLENFSISGLQAESNAGGMALRQSIPNPGNDIVEISYVLATSAEVELALYDAQGSLVRILDAGTHAAGERSVRVSVQDLPTGVYHYRLLAGGTMLSRSMNIVR